MVGQCSQNKTHRHKTDTETDVYQANHNNRVLTKNLVALGFLWSVSYVKPIPTHEKLFAVGKSGPNATLNLFFLGLGWPWVGEFVGFIVTFTCFQTQNSLVYHKHLSIILY